MALNENLINLMQEKKITIKELSNKTEISEATLKKLRISSNANPTLDVLIKITKALGITLNELIENKSKLITFSQGELIELSQDVTEFIYIFKKDTFTFSKGTKAIFRKYNNGDAITKYVISKQGILYERVEGQNSNFIDENFDIYSLNLSSILAFITKELYEVNYV